jgi:hypothetical protein
MEEIALYVVGYGVICFVIALFGVTIYCEINDFLDGRGSWARRPQGSERLGGSQSLSHKPPPPKEPEYQTIPGEWVVITRKER